jgi:hypothetical protein
MKSRAFFFVLTLALATNCMAGNNNDWPTKVKPDCGKVKVSPEPTKPVQSEPKPEPLWKRTSACLTDFFTARPAHATVQSIVPGGGFGVGPTLSLDFNHDQWQRNFLATAVSSFRQFWLADWRYKMSRDKFGDNNSARDRFVLEFYARALGLPHMVYYGIGPNTSTASVTEFSERYVVAGVDAFNPFSSWFGMGATLEGIWPDVNGVNIPGVRSITSTFTESTAPGLTMQRNLIHYGVYAEPRRWRKKFEFEYKIGYNLYQDHDTGHYTFRRFEVDGLHIFQPFHEVNSKSPLHSFANDIFTVHNRLSLSDTSGTNVVPFYMQETLGGSDINGQTSLRGFVDYRFRAPDLALIQLEYDHRLWGPVGLLGFYDTGEVANRAGDLSLANMRHSAGVGMSIWAGNKAWFKIYIGLGSGEGAHPYFGIPGSAPFALWPMTATTWKQ